MIEVKISNNLKMILIASPQYLAQYGTPTQISDLVQHKCLCLRLPTRENIMDWEFYSNSNKIIFTPKGNLIVNNNYLVTKACLSHLGIAWLPEDRIIEELARGELVEILPETSIIYDSYYLYYQHRRQDSSLFKALVDTLKVLAIILLKMTNYQFKNNQYLKDTGYCLYQN